MQLLTAVNRLFLAAGERMQLDALTGLHPLEQDAQLVLAQTSTTLQGQGWWFNTYTDDFDPDVDGRIAAPTGAISFEGRGYLNQNLIIRGAWVYDRKERTNILSRQVRGRVIEQWEFEELPESFAQWLVTNAEFQMASTFDADPTKLQTLQAAIGKALIPMHREHIRSLNVNMLHTNSMHHKMMRSNQLDRYSR